MLCLCIVSVLCIHVSETFGRLVYICNERLQFIISLASSRQYCPHFLFLKFKRRSKCILQLTELMSWRQKYICDLNIELCQQPLI